LSDEVVGLASWRVESPHHRCHPERFATSTARRVAKIYQRNLSVVGGIIVLSAGDDAA
jgi:hypothetical protein